VECAYTGVGGVIFSFYRTLLANIIILVIVLAGTRGGGGYHHLFIPLALLAMAWLHILCHLLRSCAVDARNLSGVPVPVDGSFGRVNNKL
jgi:hypothetical protein